MRTKEITPREAWLGIQEGAQCPGVRATAFRSEDGTIGALAECHITGETSAHPGAWMFRLSGSQAWHWEQSLTPA